MDELEGLYQTQYTPLSEMTEGELRQEVARWRRMWTWVPEDCKYYLARVGSLVRVINRSNKGYVGIMLQPHFELTEIEVEVENTEYNYEDGKRYLEDKVLRIPKNQLVHMEFIASQEEVLQDPYSKLVPEGIPDQILEGLLRSTSNG